MKVYIVLYYYYYEGYGEPLFVSSDKKQAEKFVMGKLEENVKRYFPKGVEHNYQEYCKLIENDIIRSYYDIFDMDVVE